MGVIINRAKTKGRTNGETKMATVSIKKLVCQTRPVLFMIKQQQQSLYGT